MKKLTQTTLSIIVVLLLSVTFTQCKDAKDAVVKKFLEVQVDQINKQCPINMGSGLSLEKASVEGSKTLQYDFIISEEIAQAMDLEAGKPAAIQTIKNLPDFDKIKEYEIEIVYNYYDSDKKLVGEIKITPDDYK